MTSTAAPVPDTLQLARIATACGRAFGHATLNAPGSLNALSLAMIEALEAQFAAWQADPDIAGIVIDGAGDRAFCAGGDIRDLYRSILEHGPARNPYAERFFAREYRLDYRIHTSGKPVLVWGHGIVMGGGIGLFAGASHRVVTRATRLAMPEVSIGLFPDVGGSWILDRLPGRTGAFLALTGTTLSAADACHAGLADFVLPHASRAAILERIAATRWDDDAATRAARLAHLLAAAADVEPLPPSDLARHRRRIDDTIGFDTLPDIAPRLASLADSDDPWLARAARGFLAGSPTSAALGLVLQRHCRHRSLADTFRIEYNAALACCAGHDFREGVRALLIDKDRQPHWQPARIADLDPDTVAAHLLPRVPGPHPLDDLG